LDRWKRRSVVHEEAAERIDFGCMTQNSRVVASSRVIMTGHGRRSAPRSGPPQVDRLAAGDRGAGICRRVAGPTVVAAERPCGINPERDEFDRRALRGEV
jgi:hypothetical protein